KYFAFDGRSVASSPPPLPLSILKIAAFGVVLLAGLLGLLIGAEMSEVEPPPRPLRGECLQNRPGGPAASDVTDRGVGVVRDGVLRATKGDVDPGCVAAGPGVPLQRHVCLRAIWSPPRYLWPLAGNRTGCLLLMAAVCASPSTDSTQAGSAGLTSTPMREAPGTSSCSSANRFATNSPVKKLMPVAWHPGRLRLPTKPTLTGSSPTPKTIGMAEVAACTARTTVGGLPGMAMITTRRRKSAANSGMRSYRPSAQRYSIATFCPSTKPISLRSLRKAAKESTEVSSAPNPRNPITGIAGCCARAANDPSETLTASDFCIANRPLPSVSQITKFCFGGPS